jgi:hypothetical protein
MIASLAWMYIPQVQHGIIASSIELSFLGGLRDFFLEKNVK